MSDDELQAVILLFRSGILQGRPSRQMCYMVCLPLQGYLRSVCGVETDLIEGLVDGWHHYWLGLPDGRIIDPTADQFTTPSGESMPPLYFGHPPSWYVDEGGVAQPASA